MREPASAKTHEYVRTTQQFRAFVSEKNEQRSLRAKDCHMAIELRYG
jgi:hypothetical protein